MLDDKNFGEDPCAHTYVLGVNTRIWAGTDLHQNFCGNVFGSLKLHKDPSFRCGDICKSELTFRNPYFTIYFHISTVMHLQSLKRWINAE